MQFRPALGLRAALNFTAETEIETPETTYTITVQVAGTTDRYRVRFVADDPSLTRADILSLLTFGKTTAALQATGGGIAAQDLLLLAPAVPYGRGVEKEVRSLLRVDRVEFTPAFSQTTGAFEPRLTIGKQFTDQLRALVSTTFGVSTRRSVVLEYRTSPRISLLGSWESRTEDQAGAFGGWIQFRYAFWTFPRFTLLGSP